MPAMVHERLTGAADGVAAGAGGRIPQVKPTILGRVASQGATAPETAIPN